VIRDQDGKIIWEKLTLFLILWEKSYFVPKFSSDLDLVHRFSI
jgi:hypothetical protein